MVRSDALIGKMLALLIGAAAAIPMAANAAYKALDPSEAQGLHGELHFGGTVAVAPCRISLDSQEQTIDLGEQSTGHFRNVGDMTMPVPFSIHIKDCLRTHYVDNPYTMSRDLNTEGSLVRIAFFGEGAGPNAPELLGGGGLQGVGVRLMDSEGRLIPLGQDSDPLPLHFDNDTLPLKVALQSHAPQRDIKMGRFQTLTTFRLSYR